MKIILANPRGFCAGVNMAIETVEQVLKSKGPPVFVYHEIVHNRHVVEGFQRQGVTFANTSRTEPMVTLRYFGPREDGGDEDRGSR